MSADGTEELASIYFFELPAFVATNSVATAQLSILFNDFDGAPSFSIDLYGLGFVSSDTLDNDWFYEGAAPDPTTSSVYGTGGPANLVSLIGSDFLAPATTPATTLVENSSTLVEFLNGSIDNGAGPGDFVVFRLNADSDTSPLTGTGYNVGHSTPSTPASLSLTAVPIPGVLWLLLSACVGLLSARKRAI